LVSQPRLSDHITRDVRVLDHPGQSALKLSNRLRPAVGPAAALVGKADDPVDLRERLQGARTGEVVDDCGRSRRCAVDRRNNGDIVACPHATVASSKPGERPLLLFRNELDGLEVLTDRVVAFKLADGKAMRMNVVSGVDTPGREADDLPVTNDGVTLANSAKERPCVRLV
jgi:hypothetical protein